MVAVREPAAYITTLDRDETKRYLEMFYALMYRPLADAVRTQPSTGERR